MKMSHTISFRVTELVLANNMLQSTVWGKIWLGVAYALIQRLLRFSNDLLMMLFKYRTDFFEQT